jgi:hypothetical protein
MKITLRGKEYQQAMNYKEAFWGAVFGVGVAFLGGVAVPAMRSIEPVGIPGLIFIAIFGFFLSLLGYRTSKRGGRAK